MEKMVTRELLDHLFDYKDGKFFWKNPSKYHKNLVGQEAGTPTMQNKKFYVNIQINGKKLKRSRLVFFYTHGKFPNPCVDHINGDSTDDRPSNLREASWSENSWNKKYVTKKTNLPMGVRKDRNGRFVARIAKHKKTFALGTFDTLEEARQVYLEKRRDLYGEFA
jgi:hypothetical protein